MQNAVRRNLHGFVKSHAPQLADSGTDAAVAKLLQAVATQSTGLNSGQILALDFYNAGYEAVKTRRQKLSILGISGVALGALALAVPIYGGMFGVLKNPSLESLQYILAISAAGIIGGMGTFSANTLLMRSSHRKFSKQGILDGKFQAEAPTDRAVFRAARKMVTAYLKDGSFPTNFKRGTGLTTNDVTETDRLDREHTKRMNKPLFETEEAADFARLIAAGLPGNHKKWNESHFAKYAGSLLSTKHPAAIVGDAVAYHHLYEQAKADAGAYSISIAGYSMLGAIATAAVTGLNSYVSMIATGTLFATALGALGVHLYGEHINGRQIKDGALDDEAPVNPLAAMLAKPAFDKLARQQGILPAPKL